MKYEWKYGENDNQKYYDVTVGKDFCLIFIKESRGTPYFQYI